MLIVLIFNYLKNKIYGKRLENAKREYYEILEKAKKEAESIKSQMVVNAKEEIHKFREDAENQIFERHKDIQSQEKKLQNKEELLNQRIEAAANSEKMARKRIEEYEKLKKNQIRELEKISKMNSKEAKNQIMKILDGELSREKANSIFKFEKELKQEKEQISQKIISDAILKYSCDYVSDISVSVVRLPSDEFKGCIIGREGRNVRTLENLAGVDLIIDDTPGTITISCFDPYKREIAKKAIEMLISDGRIQPAKIEEMLKKAKKEVDRDIRNEGQKAVLDLQLCELHPDLIEIIGKLKYRTSYGQNALKHSLEVAYISGLLASELGLDSSIAKRCGLLHDIGKAMTYSIEGSHVDVGVSLLEKYSEPKEVINAVASHHGDSKPDSAISVIVQAADTISASRPGARKENLEDYVNRIKKLEDIVNQFDMVERCYAIQAGKEIRVIVSPEKISDDEMLVTAREICKKIEDNLIYPGQIKVSMIRESRVIDYAK